MGLLAVAAKPTNKAGRPHRTQSRVRVTQALDRVREAARQSALLIRVPLGPRPWLRRFRSQDCSVGCAVFVATAASALAQNLETAQIQPAPAAIGADVPATYFGPQRS